MKKPLKPGEKHHRWTIVKPLDGVNKQGYRLCIAKCDCGTIRTVKQTNSRSGSSKSCGCIAKEINGDRVRTHNLTNHPLYPRWKSMVRRCHNESDSRYKYYGARGISVCNEWKDSPQLYFDWFYSQSDDENLTVDRIDTFGDYSPENCRLITQKEQLNNLRPRKDRLPDETVLKIKRMLSEGNKVVDIVKETGVNKSIIYNIKKGASYKSVN